VGPRANDASASALQRESGSGGEALNSRDIPQLIVSKRKADELSSQDCPSEPARLRPAPEHLFDDVLAAQYSTGEEAAQCSRQVGPTEGGPVYAALVAGRAGPQQPSGTKNPKRRVQVTLNKLCGLRQPLGSFLKETFPGLCVRCLMAPLQTPT
jgi:hypothetical protein